MRRAGTGAFSQRGVFSLVGFRRVDRLDQRQLDFESIPLETADFSTVKASDAARGEQTEA
jgi:hypothetical protein